MGIGKIQGSIYFTASLLLISLLASGFSCTLTADNIEGDWNPDTFSVSRLSITERESFYSVFESTILQSQSDLDDFVFNIQQLNRLTGEFLQTIAAWQIDFNTDNIILYRHTETSGGTIVTVGEPLIQGNQVTVDIQRGALGVTDDMAYYCYAFKVSKHIASVTFAIEGKDDVSVQLNDGKTITSQESSLTTTIEGIECEIEIHLLRNSHISGYPITGRVTISPLNTTSLPTTWAVKDEILLVHGSKTFRRELVQDDPESSHWQFVIDNNPELETGTNVSVILELSVTYLTFAPSEENSKTYTLVFNNVPVFTCR